MKMCICINSLVAPFGHFTKNKEYSCQKEGNIFGVDVETVYVYFEPSTLPDAPISYPGVRFYVNRARHDGVAYFYDHFENPRIAKLNKLNVL